MDARQFLTEFAHVVAAPQGIQRLRELILELAIRGDLLQTTEATEPASVLVEAIAAHRKLLLQQGQTRKQISLTPIEISKFSFKLPTTWAAERLGNVCEIIRGVTFSTSQKQTVATTDSIICLRTTNVQAEIDWNDLIYIDKGLVKHEDQWLCTGDTIISMANSYELVGKVSLVREVKQRATFGGFLAVIRPYLVNPNFMYLVMLSPYMQNQIRATASQTTNIANISLKGIRPIPIPIPPLDEQKRIVAKVDELMALCDKLEAQQRECEALRGFTQTSILY